MRRASRTRGLTLVEVLAAVSVLSLLAATVVPWFADAVRTLREQPRDPEARLRLIRAADALAQDPVGAGLESLPPGEAVEWSIPVGDQVVSVTVVRFPAPPDDRLGRGFFTVSSASAGGESVLRWRSTPDPEPGAHAQGASK